MKIPIEYTILTVVLFLVIVMSLMASSMNIVPYRANDIFTREYPYEGFRSKPLDYSPTNGGQSQSDSAITDYSIASPNADCKKVKGFNGLFCKPYVADNSLDIYSKAEGKLNCNGMGYHNSKGDLCLDEMQKKLLMSRGGNATGRSDEIGQ